MTGKLQVLLSFGILALYLAALLLPLCWLLCVQLSFNCLILHKPGALWKEFALRKSRKLAWC